MTGNAKLANKKMNDFVLVYLDDVIVYSLAAEKHMYHMATVLERLQTHGLFVKQKKWSFAITSTSFLGTISENGNQPKLEK